ncbi:MAG: DUF72 domain-containing protein [bacterium]
MSVRFGTMGWAYEDWKGPFYTSDLPAGKFLTEYCRIFSTVELDTTFYGAPRPSTLQGWASQVPDDFRFSAKVPRAITHEQRLRSSGTSAREFGDLLRDHLGRKLGSILLQLPPDFNIDERGVLETFLDEAVGDDRPNAIPLVVEFRSIGWERTDIAESLLARGLRCATTERIDSGSPLCYVRLLGEENAVARFNERQFDRSADLKRWAERIRVRDHSEDDLYFYVRNFYEGHAPATLFALMEMLNMIPPTPPGQQQMSLF